MPKTLEQIVQEGVGSSGTNPFTTADIAGAYQKEFGSSISQEDLGKAMDLRAKYRQPQVPSPQGPQPNALAENLNPGNNVIDGTDSINKQNNLLNNNVNETLTQLDTINKNQMTDLNTGMQDIKDLIANTKAFTDVDLAQIEAAGAAAGLPYDPLIQEARESKRQGLAKATVNAGEIGGFENTQFAGQAALTQTEGGNFVGAGGELSKIKGQLDLNISKLEIAKQQAINAAKAAEQNAIRTGKQQDVDNAMDILQLARNTYATQQDAITKRIDVIAKLKEQTQSDILFGQQQEDRAIESVLGTLQSQLTGDPTQDRALIEQTAREQGVDANRLTTVLDDYVSQKQDDALKTVASKIDIANQIPEGEIYVDEASGVRILGTKPGETMDIVQTIGNNEYQVRYDLSDPTNPKKLFAIDLGPRWKTTGGSSSGNTTSTNVNDAITEAANYLNGLKDKGQFDDTVYGITLSTLASEYNIEDPDLAASLQSTLNNRLAALRGEPIYTPPTAEEQKQQASKDYSAPYYNPFTGMKQKKT